MQAAKGQAWTLPVCLASWVLTALLDSESSVSMVRSALLPPLPVLHVTSVACFHGHVEHCPVVMVPLHYRGERHKVAVAQGQCLPYVMLLGWNAPGFAEAV